MASNTPSRLHVPLEITRQALVEVVNAQLPQVLLQDPDFAGYGVAIDVIRAGRLELAFRQNPQMPNESPRLYYELPLKIAVRKNAILTTLRADGELRLKFSTIIGLKSDWQVNAKTELISYAWSRQPQLGVGGLSIPIEGLTSRLISRIKNDLTKQVDQGIEDNVSIRSILESTMLSLSEPQILSADIGGYLSPNPIAIGMGPLTESNGGIATILQIDLRPHLGLGSPPRQVVPPSLPNNIGVQNPSDRFEMTINSLLSYEEMERVLATALLDTVLSASGRNATIKEIEIYGQGERLVVGIRLTGDYVGWAYLRAQPVFDADSDRLELRNLDVQLDTKNLLYKTIGLLFKGRIQRAMNDQIGDQVGAQLEAARLTIAEQINDSYVVPGIRLRGNADKVRIAQTLVTPQGLTAEILFTGSLAVIVESIPVE